MLTIDISKVVELIVRQEVYGNPRPDKALYINFDLQLRHYFDGRSYIQKRGLHLLYHYNLGISVFSGITDSPFASIGGVKKWKHESSHSSCWKEIRIFSDVYFEMAQQINNELKKEGFPAVAPSTMLETNSFRHFDRMYDIVTVKVSKDKTDSLNYRKTIEVQREVKLPQKVQ